MNATRYSIGNALSSFGLPITYASGGQTKYNRIRQNYPKEHWIDAACVGDTGENVTISSKIKPLLFTATGRGSRQMCGVNKYGFPRTSAKKQKRVHGFQTGDIVKAVVAQGKKEGIYIGRVAVRSSGSFNITTKTGTTQGIGQRYCNLIHRTDGYSYSS